MTLSRRKFIKLTGLSMGALVVRPWHRLFQISDLQTGAMIGRVNVGMVDVKAKPDVDSQTVNVLYEDSLVLWLREVIGWNVYRTNQRWVETPDGFIWAPHLQPVRNLPNTPVDSLPVSEIGTGMWVEVSVPFVDLVLENPPPRAPWLVYKLEHSISPRLYYSQVTWIDQLRNGSDGKVWYRVNERYGNYGDIFWAPAEAFRPITEEEVSPINPEVQDKRILVDTNYQTMSCFEGDQEVYFARVSTGAKWNAEGNPVDVWLTPIGKYPIWRKLFALHMSGGTTGGGWDLPGVCWVSLFVGSGVAVHGTFWHNNYGEPMSNGCINARPDDAKWVLRWSQPQIPFEQGDITIQGVGGTIVEVI